jgi:hypothetical protein
VHARDLAARMQHNVKIQTTHVYVKLSINPADVSVNMPAYNTPKCMEKGVLKESRSRAESRFIQTALN